MERLSTLALDAAIDIDRAGREGCAPGPDAEACAAALREVAADPMHDAWWAAVGTMRRFGADPLTVDEANAGLSAWADAVSAGTGARLTEFLCALHGDCLRAWHERYRGCGIGGLAA